MARTTNQPTFDFLTGTELAPARSSRESFRETIRQTTTREIANDDTLRAQLKRLQYELDAVKQERELVALQHQEELRNVQERAEADFKRAQHAQSEGGSATRRLETLQREHTEITTRAANEKAALDKKLRDVQVDNRALRDEVEDAQAQLQETTRRQHHAYEELEQRCESLQTSFEETQADLISKVTTLQTAQQQLAKKEAENVEMEKEVLRLKAQSGDAETLEVIRKELTEQVDYIRKLEETNRQQLTELRQTRKNAKSVEIVEEEKRGLEGKLKRMQDLKRELDETQIRCRILQDEKNSWASYLEAQSDDTVRYNTPEEIAKALLQERIERLSFVDHLGSVQSELAVKEDQIRALEEQLRAMRQESEQLRPRLTSGQTDVKAKARLEKQRNLALKEVEYLRAQIKSMEAEENEFAQEPVEQRDNSRIETLETMLDQYRSELQAVHAQLSDTAMPVQSPKKRAREDDEDVTERMGELLRKAKTLQDSLSQLQIRNSVLEAELKASSMQVTSLKETRSRTLELRNNPTAQFEAIKLATLTTLREENADLLARLDGKPTKSKVVPISSLESSKQQLEEVKAQLAQTEKKIMRLKQIWSSKSLEFREAVASILGWKLDFMPNGRVKATSILHAVSIVDDEEEENSIVFDGEQGTMKVSGGPKSVFAQEIRGLIDFWVEGRKEIPCFLAACTLEFYDRTTRAQKM